MEAEHQSQEISMNPSPIYLLDLDDPDEKKLMVFGSLLSGHFRVSGPPQFNLRIRF